MGQVAPPATLQSQHMQNGAPPNPATAANNAAIYAAAAAQATQRARQQPLEAPPHHMPQQGAQLTAQQHQQLLFQQQQSSDARLHAQIGGPAPVPQPYQIPPGENMQKFAMAQQIRRPALANGRCVKTALVDGRETLADIGLQQAIRKRHCQRTAYGKRGKSILLARMVRCTLRPNRVRFLVASSRLLITFSSVCATA